MTCKTSNAPAASRTGRSLKTLSRILLGVAVMTTSACAGSVTPPESTPVYADEIAPGIEPVAVERTSVNRPEVNAVATPKEGNGMSGDDQAISVGEDAPKAAPISSKAPASDEAAAGTEAACEAEPAAPNAPLEPAPEKIAPAPANATPAATPTAKKSDTSAK